jgi:hypothetical protein
MGSASARTPEAGRRSANAIDKASVTRLVRM